MGGRGKKRSRRTTYYGQSGGAATAPVAGAVQPTPTTPVTQQPTQ